MLVLMCCADEHRYAVPAACVVEVVPSVRFDPVAETPDWLAGVFAYRGRATPLVDLTQMITGASCPRRWNSRIMVIHFDSEGMPETLGLLAERVTTAEIDAEDAAGDNRSEVGALGPILLDERGAFQLIDLSRLLGGERREAIQPITANARKRQ
jgi:chemotaxis-related protein WspB